MVQAWRRYQLWNVEHHALYPELHPWKALRPWKRHSLVLMVAGLVYIFVGISYITTEPTAARYQALVIAHAWMPFKAWGVVWIFAGILAIISSRWPPISKTWGYMVLTGLSSGWAGFYLMGVLVAHSPKANISGALSWGLIGFLWWAISGLLNPNDVRMRAHLQTGMMSDPLDNPR